MASNTAEPGHEDTVGEPVDRRLGRMFELVCLGATVFGILMVTILFMYVANDAFRPFSADPGWHLVYLCTVGGPAIGLVGYYYVRNGAAGHVAYEAVGIPIVGLLVGGGLVVLFVEIISVNEWTGLIMGLLAAGGLISVHRRYRTEAALERLVVVIVAPLVTTVGVPAFSIDFTAVSPFTRVELFHIAFSTPALVPGLMTLVPKAPVLPAEWILLVGTVSIPTAVLFGRLVAHRRDDDQGVREMIGATVVVASAGAFVAPSFGLATNHWVLLATTSLVPLGYYLEGVFRRQKGRAGLVFPVVLVAGILLGGVIVRSFGFAGPDPWLDWSFITSPTSRTPEDAGIYPPLVGSVLMLVVIIVSAFPIGVGAAIYLEEYAPQTGRTGRLVQLIEINIGNLAGVPSVVYGLLGLALFIQGIGFRAGIVIVGGFTVGLLILPIVIISAQEAIRAVPDSMRRASYGMGATKWQTTRNVVLPEALPGILTGTILALGRAIGETAPLLMIGAASSVRTAPSGFFSKFSAMPRQIFAWSSEIKPEFRFGVLAAGVVTLMVVLLLMNGTAILIRNKSQRGN